MKHEEQIIDLFDGLDPALIDAYFQKEEKLLKKRKRAVILTRALSLAACFLLLVGLLALSPLRSFFKSPALSTDQPQESRPDEQASGAHSKESTNLMPEPSPPSDRMYFSSTEQMLEWFFSNTGGQNQALQFAENDVMGEETATFVKQIVYGEKLLPYPVINGNPIVDNKDYSPVWLYGSSGELFGKTCLWYHCAAGNKKANVLLAYLTDEEMEYAKDHTAKELISFIAPDSILIKNPEKQPSISDLREIELVLSDRTVNAFCYTVDGRSIRTIFAYDGLLVYTWDWIENGFGSALWSQFGIEYETNSKIHLGDCALDTGLNEFFPLKVMGLPEFLLAENMSEDELKSFLTLQGAHAFPYFDHLTEGTDTISAFINTVNSGGYYEVKDFDAYGVTYDERTGNYRFIYRKGDTIYCFDFVEKQFGLDEYLKAFTDYTNYNIEEIGFYPWLTSQSLESGNYDKNNDLHFFVLDDQHEGFCVFLRVINMDETLLENRRSFKEWALSTFTYKTDLSQFGKEGEEEVQ
ncbi:MAG: hypothetical protein IJZ37_04955 [Clostridia bacterium]|nr:hypothetical protein [Clostridia bacterium]